MAQTTIQGSFLGDATVTGAKIGADFISAQTALTTGLATTDEIIVSDAGVIKRMDISVIEIAATQITASGTLPALNGAALTALTAANITASGTLPALNGAALTALTAANITASGTLPALNGAALTALTAANITASGTLPALNGAALTALNGTQVTSGTLPAARIAADSIVEGKLNVSNGPTNGYVLTARDGVAGGFTWEAASAGATLSGSTDNTVVTVTGANAMVGEANLTFAGTTLGVGASSPVSMTKMVQIDSAGNAPLIMGTWASGYSGYMTNAYFDGSSWKYVGNGYAMGMRFHFVGGSPGYMFFNVASNNTSGADAALSNWDGSDRKMQIAPDGEVSVRENTSMPSVTKGIAKAWCKFNGTSSGPITNDQSYNCDATTDSGTGLYTVNFTTNFSSAHPAVVAGGNALHHVEHHAAAAGTYSVKGLNSSHAVEDAARMYLIAFGESS